MARPYGSDPDRWPDERRRWTEGERDPREESWREREGGMMAGGRERHRWSEERGREERYRESHDQGRGGGYPGGWGGAGGYGSSTGGYAASGLTGSTGRWGPGGAGYSGRGETEGARVFRGRGPKGYRRSDDRIREDVCERIARSGMNAENVEVQVEGGEVTLSGEVESRMDRWRLEEVVDDVFGVDEVHNHLRLRRERSTATETSRSAQASEGDDAGLPH